MFNEDFVFVVAFFGGESEPHIVFKRLYAGYGDAARGFFEGGCCGGVGEIGEVGSNGDLEGVCAVVVYGRFLGE